MPDENTTPIGANQSSQNNHITVNQGGDDFVLDFGDGENNVQMEVPGVEPNNLEGEEQEENEEMVRTDIDLNSNDLFGEEKKDEGSNVDFQNDIEVEDENVDDGKLDDFDITLDDNLSQENSDTSEEENKKINGVESENSQEDEFFGNDNDLFIKTDNSEESSQFLEEESKIQDEEVSDEEVSDEEVSDEEVSDEEVSDEEVSDEEVSDEEVSDEEVSDEEVSDEEVSDEEVSDEEVSDEEVSDEEVSDEEVSDEEVSDEEVSDEEVSDEDKLFSEEEGDNLEENNNDDIDENMQENITNEEIFDDSESKESLDSISGDENMKNESKEADALENIENVIEDNKSETGLYETENKGESNQENRNDTEFDGGEFTFNAENENHVDSYQEESVNEEVNKKVNDENNNTDSNPELHSDLSNDIQEPLNQPEIGDLLGDSAIDFSQGQESTVNEGGNEVTGEINQVLVDAPVNTEVLMPENSELVNENNQNESSLNNETENSIKSEPEIQNFTLDYQEPTENKPQNESVENIPDENIERVNVEEPQLDTMENQVNSGDAQMNVGKLDTAINTTEDENQLELQQITSTLSLDQILDSELNTNPGFTDDSKAVPVNVSNNNGLFKNKKMVGILAGLGIFLLVGAVAFLAFPFGSSERKPGAVVDSQDITEEYTDDHQSADLTDDSENNSSENDEEDNSGNIISHGGNATVEQDFPDADWEDEGESDWQEDLESPNPYICEGDECLSFNNNSQINQIEKTSIMPVIDDYKSQAENYYSVGNDMQDKKLVKYSLQLMTLCNTYQGQIESGEGLDEASLASFKSDGDALLEKIDKYLNQDDTELFISNNDYQDYGGNDDLRDYIYDRANGYTN